MIPHPIIPNPFDNPQVAEIAFYVSAGMLLVFCLAMLGTDIYRSIRRRRKQNAE